MKIDEMSSIGGSSYSVPEVKNKVPDISTAETVTAGETFFGRNNAEDAQKNAPSENTIRQAVSDINKKINPNTVAQYGYHEETKRVTIKIVDKESEKIIKEFPAEETLDMIAKVWELAGMFLDERG